MYKTMRKDVQDALMYVDAATLRVGIAPDLAEAYMRKAGDILSRLYTTLDALVHTQEEKE